MPLTAFDLNANHLLAALPRPDRERWRSSLEGVVLGRGQVLHEPGRSLRHAYFPVDAVVSLQVQSNNGGCDEVAIVGHEGMVGVSIFMGGGAATSLQAVVQNPGLALRWSADWVRDEFEGSCAVLRLLLQYVASQDVQLAQGVVCSRHHSIEQRLALRLLVGAKCQRNSKLAMTHEQLAMSLGVRRASVTEAALKLQQAGLIACSRGRIVVLDEAGLRQRSCACLPLVMTEYRRLEPACVETTAAAA